MAGFVLDKNNRNFSDISCLLQRRERRRVRKRSVVLKQPPVRERVRRGAKKIIISSILHHPENTLTAVGKVNVKEIYPRRKLRAAFGGGIFPSRLPYRRPSRCFPGDEGLMI